MNEKGKTNGDVTQNIKRSEKVFMESALRAQTYCDFELNLKTTIRQARQMARTLKTTELKSKQEPLIIIKSLS